MNAIVLFSSPGSAEATRPHWDPFTPENQRIVTLSWSEPPTYYDPLIREVETREAVLAELRAADAEGKELLVNLGRLDLQEKRRPDMMALVRTPELFEEV